MRSRAKKLLLTICDALLGLAVLLLVVNLLIFLTGQAASLNNFIASEPLRRFFIGEPGAYYEVKPEVLRDIMVNFYLPVVIGGAICLVVVLALLLNIMVEALARLGRLTMNIVARWLNVRDVRYRLLITFALWAAEILSTWLVLNVASTFSFLMIGVVLMVIDLLLGWATQNYVVDEAQSELKQAKRAAKESA